MERPRKLKLRWLGYDVRRYNTGLATYRLLCRIGRLHLFIRVWPG